MRVRRALARLCRRDFGENLPLQAAIGETAYPRGGKISDSRFASFAPSRV